MEEKKELEFRVSEECNDPNCDHDHDLVSDVTDLQSRTKTEANTTSL